MPAAKTGKDTGTVLLPACGAHFLFSVIFAGSAAGYALPAAMPPSPA